MWCFTLFNRQGKVLLLIIIIIIIIIIIHLNGVNVVFYTVQYAR